MPVKERVFQLAKQLEQASLAVVVRFAAHSLEHNSLTGWTLAVHELERRKTIALQQIESLDR